MNLAALPARGDGVPSLSRAYQTSPAKVGLDSRKEKSMQLVKPEACVLLSLVLLIPVLAQAADNFSAPTSVQTMSVAQSNQTGTPDAIGAHEQQQPAEYTAGMGPSMSPESLDQYRGGAAVNSIKSEAISNGLLQDATATNVAAGNNTITEGAFSNSVGLPIVIQNSGANVLIQNSTIVNVQFR
jgi:hypothetical protein